MDEKAVVRGFVAAINAHDLQELARWLAPDVVDHNKIIHGEGDEPGAALDGFRQQLAAFGDLHAEIEDLIAEGATVVVRMTVSGTHTGRHPRMPEPTGRSFSVQQIWILTVTDERVGEIRAVSDRLTMFIQLGWDGRPSRRQTPRYLRRKALVMLERLYYY